MTKKDYYIAATVGLLTGIFAIPTVFNLGFQGFPIYLSVVIIPAVLFPFGVWFGNFLSRWFPFMEQMGKFVAVGFLNTTIDFAALNILSLASGITAGFKIGGINIPGFIAAVSNSYFWNRFWVFNKNTVLTIKNETIKEDKINGMKNFVAFFVVSIVGLIINSGIVYFFTTFITPFFPTNPQTWLNISKILATIVSLVWNFLGFKFLVFKN